MKFSDKHSTARRVAFARSWESHRPAQERVCFDPFARGFLDWTGKFLSANPLGRKLTLKIATPLERGILGYVPLRTREIDDYALACVKGGVEQLVIMGAGYDARPYRLDELKQLKMIFEVDLGRNQDDKLARLGGVLGEIPDHVTFVPTDFETETLDDTLLQSGYSPELKTLFIWEGVTFYLAPNAVDQTLAFIVNKSAHGSSIIFDYLHADVVSGVSDDPLAKDLMEYGAKIGEPYKFGLAPESVSAFLADRGFSQVKNLSSEQCEQMYCLDDEQDRNVISLFSIVHALTGSAEVGD